jgi:predicted N-acetyltransferase YhbS
MSALHIRKARPGDSEAIRMVTLSAYEEYAWVMPYWVYFQKNIRETLEDPKPADQMVAERNGAILGAVMLYPAGTVFTSADGDRISLRWPEMRLLAVSPGARRQGIGASLVRECIRRARRSGAEFLVLHTNTIMNNAIRLYEQVGFEHYPDLDFVINDKVTVRVYRFDLKKKIQKAS